jgi:hypothetical protein
VNEFLAASLNLLNGSTQYSSSYYGVRVSVIGGGYTLTTEEALKIVSDRVDELELIVPTIKNRLIEIKKEEVEKAHEELIKVGGS